ncbi:unnamed protein product, partial [Cladocopium goreaui]
VDASEYRAFAEHVHVMDVNGPPAEGYYKWLKELVLDQANSSEAEVIRLDQVTCDLSPGDGRWRWVTRETILHKFELWSAGYLTQRTTADWAKTMAKAIPCKLESLQPKQAAMRGLKESVQTQAGWNPYSSVTM